MGHFVQSRNLPYSLEEVKKMRASCSYCAELKPEYHKATQAHLTKATQPFERLNIDFKRPLPSASKNKYLVTVVDEYSRFPFAFACTDMTSPIVIKCLTQLLSIFGIPACAHSDIGPSFLSVGLKQFLHSHGISTSCATAYNPPGNGQVERNNGIIWQAVTLALKAQQLLTTQWEIVLPDALHSIRSQLLTQLLMNVYFHTMVS